MKRLRKSLLVLILSFCCMFAGMDTVQAAEKEETLFKLNEPQDIIVTIEYEVNDASFTLVAPSGFLISKDTDTENITVFAGSKSTLVFIGQAEVGEWKIRYDKGSNESIRVSASVQDTSFFITDYQVGGLAEDKMPVKFQVSDNQRLNYRYRLVLTTSRETLDGKELASGWATTNEVVEKEISLANVNSYDAYYLLLYVSYDLKGAEIFDYSYSEAFAYKRADAPEALENLDVAVNHNAKNLEIDWRKYLPGRATSVYLKAYAGEECISSAEYPKENGYSAWIPYETEGVIRLEIQYITQGGVMSEGLTKEVDVSSHLTLPESGKVNSAIWSFGYQGMLEQEVSFEVNDKVQKVILNGDGNKYLTLPERRNTIVVTYQDGDGNRHTYQREANLSDLKPTIDLLRKVDGVTTKESVIMLTGTTNAERLTVDGQDVEITDGTFAYPYSLSSGENQIEMEAVLGDGVTRLSAVVTKESAIGNIWMYPVAGLVISLVGIMILARSEKKKHQKKEETAEGATSKPAKRKGIRMSIRGNWIAVILCVVVWIALLVFTNTAVYLQVAYESLLLAKGLLILKQVLLLLALVLMVVALVRMLIQAVKRKFAERKQRKEEGENAKAEQ